MEYFDLRNPDGSLTGETKERSKVHQDGDLHGTAHVWIARQNPVSGHAELLLQKRSRQKDSFPGCYDISSAGHMEAGDDYLPTALRELKEELGIEAAAEDLEYLFTHIGYMEGEFYGQIFKNHEISAVYLYTKPVEIPELKLQKEEVESVCWMDLDTLSRQVHTKNPSYCIFADEVEELMSRVPKILEAQATSVIRADLTETWAEDAQQDLEDWIEEQGIYLRQ